MAYEAKTYKTGLIRDHTPSAALTGGQVIQLLSGLAAVALNDIAASAEGSVQIGGDFAIRNVAVLGNVGCNVWWDEDGTAVDGETGGCTTSAVDGDFWIGTLAEALAASDEVAIVSLNLVNPALPPWANLAHELKTDDYTLDAQDVGKVIHIATDAKTFTLPATVIGYRYIIQNDGADAANIITISPNSSDKIMGADLAGADDKDRINTKATANRGDFIILVADGAAGWYVEEERGTWAAEA